MSQTRTPDARLDAALRSLDAAPAAPLDDLARVRATALLERTLAVGRADRRQRPRRTRPRVVLLGAAAAAVAVGIGATQVLGGGTTAYAASWTPTPSAASPADVAAAREVCADRLPVRLAERRGDLVVLAMDSGAAEPAVTTCVVGMPPGGRAELVSRSGGGGVVRPSARSVTDAGIYQRGVAGDELSVIDGLAGEDVRAVTVRTADGRSVEATVAGGHYVAWWPGRAMTEGDEPPPSGAQGGCAGDCSGGQPVPSYTLDVTLDDGTVLRDAT